jgi:threonylcarbamoyladenosine tRNA methylthiotransferase MtaB
MKRVAFFALGCKVNHYEADAMAGLFENAGYRIVDFDAPADCLVIHSCSVTQAAERKSRQMIRKARRSNPQAVVVVTGCYAQIAPETIQTIPGVDLVIGTHGRSQIVDEVEHLMIGQGVVNRVGDIKGVTGYEEMALSTYASRTRGLIKIEEGCDQYCAYCIIPYARGPVRSRDYASVLNEAGRLAALGVKEIILTGINLGLYGKDYPGGPNLMDILSGIHEMDGIQRIRISSIEPTEVTETLLDAMEAMPKICRHLHIPLQSGDDDVLRRMNRKYRAADFLAVADAFRKRFPGGGISTDVIVGFPGETDMQFDHTCQVAAAAAFSRMHIFPYSIRPGTAAAQMTDQIPDRVKDERIRFLTRQAASQSLDFHHRLLGETLTVLLEERHHPGGHWEGWTDHYVRAGFDSEDDLANQMVMIKVTHASTAGVKGIRVES